MIFRKQNFIGMQVYIQSTILFLIISSTLISNSQAEELYTTDDYLKGLSDEISSPEYLDKAKQELLKSEQLEQSQAVSPSSIQDALASMYNFETLLRTKFPSSHSVYSKLPVSARIIIYDEFKSTKKLSSAKRMIIKKYEKK